MQRLALDGDGGSGGPSGNAQPPPQAAVFQIVQRLLQKLFEHAGGIFIRGKR